MRYVSLVIRATDLPWRSLYAAAKLAMEADLPTPVGTGTAGGVGGGPGGSTPGRPRTFIASDSVTASNEGRVGWPEPSAESAASLDGASLGVPVEAVLRYGRTAAAEACTGLAASRGCG